MPDQAYFSAMDLFSSKLMSFGTCPLHICRLCTTLNGSITHLKLALVLHCTVSAAQKVCALTPSKLTSFGACPSKQGRSLTT